MYTYSWNNLTDWLIDCIINSLCFIYFLYRLLYLYIALHSFYISYKIGNILYVYYTGLLPNKFKNINRSTVIVSVKMIDLGSTQQPQQSTPLNYIECLLSVATTAAWLLYNCRNRRRRHGVTYHLTNAMRYLVLQIRKLWNMAIIMPVFGVRRVLPLIIFLMLTGYILHG